MKSIRSGDKHDGTISFIISGLTSGASLTEQPKVFSSIDDTSDGTVWESEHEPLGVDLELSLVKRFVELHGGDIQIKASKGKGTVITCRLPATGDQNNDQPDRTIVGS